MTKRLITIDTTPIRLDIDPSGSYSLRINQQQPIADDAVFKEVAKETSLGLSEKTLAFLFERTIATMVNKVATDGIPRKVGSLKIALSIRGKVKSPYSPFNAKDCTAVVRVSTLKNFERKVDLKNFEFVNVRAGLRVTVTRVATVGADVAGVLTKSKPFMVTGTNLQYLEGDSAIVRFLDGGEGMSVAVTPTESDVGHMTFAWPAALTEVAAGSELLITLRTRGGIAESEPQTNEVKVKIAAEA